MSSGRIMFSGGTPAVHHCRKSCSNSAHRQSLLHEYQNHGSDCLQTSQVLQHCQKSRSDAAKSEVCCIITKNSAHCLMRTKMLVLHHLQKSCSDSAHR